MKPFQFYLRLGQPKPVFLPHSPDPWVILGSPSHHGRLILACCV